VILLSVVGASPTHPMDLFRAKYEAEKNLRSSGVSWTIVRSTAFVELWADILTKPIVFGGGNNPINFVSVSDVAAAVGLATIDRSLRGQILEIAGPQNPTFNDLVLTLQELRGRAGKIRHVPLWLLRAMSVASRQARAAVAMDTTDMAVRTSTNGDRPDLPMTDIRSALAGIAGATRSCVRGRNGGAR
jgi:NADH dehydrogenase